MPGAKKKGKKKINSISKVVNGIKFDSRMEADYYKVLLQLEKDGEISELGIQPEFKLLDPFPLRKRKIRGMVYTPDFIHVDPDGNAIVSEVKGHATEAYRMRRKIFLHMYGEDHIFHEVSRKSIKIGWKIQVY